MVFDRQATRFFEKVCVWEEGLATKLINRWRLAHAHFRLLLRVFIQKVLTGFCFVTKGLNNPRRC